MTINSFKVQSSVCQETTVGWWQQFEICFSEEEVRTMYSRLYKKNIKEKVNKIAFTHLISVQQNHSKIKSIKYSKLDMQPYMKS